MSEMHHKTIKTLVEGALQTRTATDTEMTSGDVLFQNWKHSETSVAH